MGGGQGTQFPGPSPTIQFPAPPKNLAGVGGDCGIFYKFLKGVELRALLALEDGLVLWGRSFTGAGEARGEVVFNTSMTGYQEILTDPSYKGQIVTMTYPLMGNYGVNFEDLESRGVQVEEIGRASCRERV